MSDSLVYMAFVTGLLGAGHCIGMCGGIISALSLSEAGRRGGWSFHLLYNIGRILTYTLIGALVGWLGSALAYTNHFKMLTGTLLLGSDLFVILIGVATAGLLSRFNVSKLEFTAPIQLMTGLVKRLQQLPPALSALPLGLLFGFIPCGWLYQVVITAAQSANPATGALMLLAFGIGTSPSLLLVGGTTHWISSKARIWMLRVAGLVVAGMGVTNLVRHLHMMGWLH